MQINGHIGESGLSSCWRCQTFPIRYNDNIANASPDSMDAFLLLEVAEKEGVNAVSHPT